MGALRPPMFRHLPRRSSRRVPQPPAMVARVGSANRGSIELIPVNGMEEVAPACRVVQQVVPGWFPLEPTDAGTVGKGTGEGTLSR